MTVFSFDLWKHYITHYLTGLSMRINSVNEHDGFEEFIFTISVIGPHAVCKTPYIFLPFLKPNMGLLLTTSSGRGDKPYCVDFLSFVVNSVRGVRYSGCSWRAGAARKKGRLAREALREVIHPASSLLTAVSMNCVSGVP